MYLILNFVMFILAFLVLWSCMGIILFRCWFYVVLFFPLRIGFWEAIFSFVDVQTGFNLNDRMIVGRNWVVIANHVLRLAMGYNARFQKIEAR